MDRGMFKTKDSRPACCRRYIRHLLIAGRIAVLVPLATACASTTPPPTGAHIDRVYRDTVTLLGRPASSRPVDFSELAGEVDALSAADLSGDPCLALKKARLSPILYSLAVIDSLRDEAEKQRLQQEALQHLLALGAPGNQPGPDNFCYGKGFPQLTDR